MFLLYEIMYIWYGSMVHHPIPFQVKMQDASWQCNVQIRKLIQCHSKLSLSKELLVNSLV
jgi:hypothetical protein